MGSDTLAPSGGNAAELLRPEELAERWRVSARHIYRLVGRGLPAVRLSDRCLRFDPEAVQTWLASRSA
jgi:excisionase family DNA binding protein